LIRSHLTDHLNFELYHAAPAASRVGGRNARPCRN
jgi:hypothetical protein